MKISYENLVLPLAVCIAGLLLIGRTLPDTGNRQALIAREEPKQEFWRDSSITSQFDRWGTRGKKGVAIVAPASGLKKPDVEKARNMADSLGFSFSHEALDPGRIPYNAAPDEVRLRLFVEALENPEIETLWMLRGGYGSGRLLRDLAKISPPETRKTVIGYSDITFLHLLLQKWGWPSVHGSMFWGLSATGETMDPDNFRLISAVLSGETAELRYGGVGPMNEAARKTAGPLSGTVRGGNMAILSAAAGTPWQLDAEGAIVVLEDVNEDGDELDRMYTQLLDSGAFSGAAAIVLGEFVGGDDLKDYAHARFAGRTDIPVFRCDFFGHGKKNHPLVFNTPALLERDGKAEGRNGGEADFLLKIDTSPLLVGQDRTARELRGHDF